MLIVNFNSTELLRESLSAVFASHWAGEVEVIVVDNASEHFPVGQLGAEFPSVTWLPQPVNTSCTGGNNLAFERATGDVLLMLNPDTRIEADAIANAVRHLETSSDVVAVGAYFVDSRGHLQRQYYRRFPRFADLPVLLFEPVFGTTRLGKWFLMTDAALGHEATVDHAAAACLFVRRNALKGWVMEPGYFNLLSDLDLSRHLATTGHIKVFDDVRCYHLGGGGGMGNRNVPARLRFLHDFTWGIRRYFRPEFNVLQRYVLEGMLVLYWITRFGRVVVTAPRFGPQAAKVAFRALVGQPPRY